ncbi:hypothetical protein [Pedobacter punctiformis]|uniref:Lipoprotein n=1 Tax=Pedobacter punctiformis TaxID=3004097 RepID=A0ABT4LD35_9SPHI|nr:hypothetical protein [Pedobacter sp. HCMS5-2]MCZ4245821.1 hypothetical protein [Pedobacter sp. HCMS5-2]
MKRFLYTILLIASASILFTSCKSTSSKMNAFVLSYNASAKPNGIVYSTNAEALYDKKIIKIRIVTNYALEDTKNGIVDKFLPTLFVQLLAGEDLARELINEEGVNFEVTFFTIRLSEFSSITIDKKKLAELEKEAKGKINADDLLNNTGNSKIKNILSILNKNLPVKDKNTGLTILKIDINDKNELLYDISVPNSIAEKIKGKDASEVLKDDILRNGNSKQLFMNVRSLGITTLKYKYRDEKGNYLNEITLTQQDFNLP